VAEINKRTSKNALTVIYNNNRLLRFLKQIKSYFTT